MDIKLKNADFSETGIPVPYEFDFTDSIVINTATGKIVTNQDDRCVDVNFVPIAYKKLRNLSQLSKDFVVAFYSSASEDDYIGIIGKSIYSYTSIQPNNEIDITAASSYVDGSGQAVSIASATHYRVGVRSSNVGVFASASKE